MSRTFLRQNTQIRNSDTYTDSLAAGITLQTGATEIQGDLNSLRSQACQLRDRDCDLFRESVRQDGSRFLLSSR
jgi:hypothetical protein